MSNSITTKDIYGIVQVLILLYRSFVDSLRVVTKKTGSKILKTRVIRVDY
jgi:hypothetical protein